MNLGFVWACLVAGAASVIQGGLNRRIAAVWGNTPTVLLNGLMLSLSAALALWLTARSDSPLLQQLAPKAGAFSRPAWWYAIPGILGFGFVATLPGAIARLGATQVFVLVVAGQMIGGLAWDALVEHTTPAPMRLAGVGLVLAGAWLAVRA